MDAVTVTVQKKAQNPKYVIRRLANVSANLMFEDAGVTNASFKTIGTFLQTTQMAAIHVTVQGTAQNLNNVIHKLANVIAFKTLLETSVIFVLPDTKIKVTHFVKESQVSLINYYKAFTDWHIPYERDKSFRKSQIEYFCMFTSLWN